MYISIHIAHSNKPFIPFSFSVLHVGVKAVRLLNIQSRVRLLRADSDNNFEVDSVNSIIFYKKRQQQPV